MPLRPHEDAAALLAYAEPLVEGRRVVVVGDASLGFGARLLELGARVVHVYDPEPARALAAAPTTASRGLTVRTLPDGDFEVRDGAFDVALVPDLGFFSEPSALVVRLRRILGPTGIAFVAAANREAAGGARGFDYYELFDLLALQWSDVHMVARVPFAGVAFAQLGEGEIDDGVAVHTDLAGDPGAPEVWVAVAASGEVALDRYSIVQLPVAPSAPVEPDPSSVASLAEAVLRANMLESQLEEHRTLRAESARDAEEARRLREALAVERERCERLITDLDKERRLRERLASELSALAHAKPEIPPDAVERIAALEDGIRLAEQTILALRERLGATEAALRDSTEAAISARAEAAALADTRVDRSALAALEDELARAAEHQAAHEAELVALEERLRERGETVAELAAEVKRREALVRELLIGLEEGGHSPVAVPAPPSDEVIDLQRRLDALARTSAELRGELEAARWRITELTRDGEPKAPAAGSAMTELDALRQALAQEHSARVRAESGEELRLARAELERQSVLLAQLKAAKANG